MTDDLFKPEQDRRPEIEGSKGAYGRHRFLRLRNIPADDQKNVIWNFLLLFIYCISYKRVWMVYIWSLFLVFFFYISAHHI